MSGPPAHTFSGRDLELELLDPGSTGLVRLFRHPGADWDPPPPERRQLRVDPPPGHSDLYAVLYTADCIQAVAAECRVLRVATDDHCVWVRNLAEQYKVARYELSGPALFIPIDGRNRRSLALEGPRRSFTGYDTYRTVALELFQRFGAVAHGMSWESFHRNQPGRVYAIWHHHKGTIGLQRVASASSSSLVADPEWLKFLSDNPAVEEVTSQ